MVSHCYLPPSRGDIPAFTQAFKAGTPLDWLFEQPTTVSQQQTFRVAVIHPEIRTGAIFTPFTFTVPTVYKQMNKNIACNVCNDEISTSFLNE